MLYMNKKDECRLAKLIRGNIYKLEIIMKKMIVCFVACGLGFLCGSIGLYYIKAASIPKVYNYGLHHDDGEDRYSWMPIVKNFYEYNSFKRSKVENHHYYDCFKLKDGFFEADYLNIHTHGNVGSFEPDDYGLVCLNRSGETTYYTVSFVRLQSSNAFRNLRVGYIGACRSAKIGRNMALELYNHGAKCTIGYRKKVETAKNRWMITMFNSNFSSGNISVANSMRNAQKSTYAQFGDYGNTDSYEIYGNKYIEYK